MKYENILWIAAVWIAIIVMWPLPDWSTTILVLIGVGAVSIVAYGMGRDRRTFMKKAPKSQLESMDTLAHDIADSLAHRPQLMNDMPAEEKLEETMRQALGDIETIEHSTPLVDESQPVPLMEEIPLPIVKAPRKRSVRHLVPETIEDESVLSPSDETSPSQD